MLFGQASFAPGESKGEVDADGEEQAVNEGEPGRARQGPVEDRSFRCHHHAHHGKGKGKGEQGKQGTHGQSSRQPEEDREQVALLPIA